MVNVRFHSDDPTDPANDDAAGGRSRFNVLLAEDRVHESEHWSRQLPRLMEPLGVTSHVVYSGEEALNLAERIAIHAAVVDLATPRIADDPDPAPPHRPGGLWILELFRRLSNMPPVVLVRSRAVSQRDVSRLLHDALRLGAFTVLENPTNLENLLTVFRRLLDREYQGLWPTIKPPEEEDTN